MADNFDYSVAEVLISEGGYVDQPAESSSASCVQTSKGRQVSRQTKPKRRSTPTTPSSTRGLWRISCARWTISSP